MKKDKDAFIKILIVLVIASLSLLAIVYVMQSNRDGNGNFTNPFSPGRCGNGIVEGKEECDGKKYADWLTAGCNPIESIDHCGNGCKHECILIEEVDTRGFIGGTEDPDLTGEDMIGAGGPNSLGGNKDFLDIKNYYSMPNIQVGIAFCEESDFAKYVKESNAVGYGHILGLYEEEFRVLFKIMERGDWEVAEIEKEMKDNICGLGDEYFGTIGDSDEYLLFIRNCPAAGSPEDKEIIKLCPLRKREVKELMNWK